MQRLSNAALSVALTVFVTAVSLALLTSSWLIATYILDGPVRSSSPKWLFIGLLMAGLSQANAQTATLDASVVVDAYPKQLNNQKAVSQATPTALDTLPPLTQTNVRSRKRFISPKPAWPNDDALSVEPVESAIIGSIVILGAYPGIPNNEFRFRRKPQ